MDGKGKIRMLMIVRPRSEFFKFLIGVLIVWPLLFGTDSPWSGQQQMLAAIRNSGLDKEEQEAVLGGNAGDCRR